MCGNTQVLTRWPHHPTPAFVQMEAWATRHWFGLVWKANKQKTNGPRGKSWELNLRFLLWTVLHRPQRRLASVLGPCPQISSEFATVLISFVGLGRASLGRAFDFDETNMEAKCLTGGIAFGSTSVFHSCTSAHLTCIL